MGRGEGRDEGGGLAPHYKVKRRGREKRSFISSLSGCFVVDNPVEWILQPRRETLACLTSCDVLFEMKCRFLKDFFFGAVIGVLSRFKNKSVIVFILLLLFCSLSVLALCYSPPPPPSVLSLLLRCQPPTPPPPHPTSSSVTSPQSPLFIFLLLYPSSLI